jgi:DNA-binding NarL/FixJ family response regulator
MRPDYALNLLRTQHPIMSHAAAATRERVGLSRSAPGARSHGIGALRSSAGRKAGAEQMTKAVNFRAGGVDAAGRAADSLTPRELEIVRLVASGLRNKEIGRQLAITEGTVKIHLHNIYQKLQVASRIELILLVSAQTQQ